MISRMTECKHLTGQKHYKTTIVRKYSTSEGSSILYWKS